MRDILKDWMWDGAGAVQKVSCYLLRFGSNFRERIRKSIKVFLSLLCLLDIYMKVEV